MRVLFSAVPAVGHIVPLLDLARAMQGAGHDVRFATNAQRHGLVAGVGLQPVSAGMSSVEMEAERRRRWPETATQPATAWSLRMFTQIMAPSMLVDLLALVREWRPDVIVHDEGEYAAPVAATAAGVPWITHGYGSPLRPISELADLEEAAAGLWGSSGLDIPEAAGLYAHVLVNPCPPLLQPDSPGAAVVWPMRSRPLSGQGVRVQADAYVGFGTVPTFADAPAELESAIRACARRGMRVVVTAPSAELRRQLTELAPGLVDAHEFVSLPELLASCKVVIAHAGAGTVLAALASSVPLVLVPRGSPSQLRMADACHRAGVGRRCDAATLASALDEVLEDKSIGAAAASAGRQIGAMPDPAEVISSVESMAKH